MSDKQMIAPDINLNFEQLKRQIDFNIRAKDEVINQLNSMYSVALLNRDKEIENLKSQLAAVRQKYDDMVKSANSEMVEFENSLSRNYSKKINDLENKLAAVTKIAMESLDKIESSNNHAPWCRKFSDCCDCMNRKIYGEDGMVNFARAKLKELNEIIGNHAGK